MTQIIKRASIGVPLMVPMFFLLYLTVISDPLMKTPIKSFMATLVVTGIIMSTIVIAGIGFYYLAFKRFD